MCGVGFLTDYVTKSQKRWQGTYIPEWMPAARWGVAIVAGAVLFFSALSSLASGDDPVAQPQSPPSLQDGATSNSFEDIIPTGSAPTGAPSQEPVPSQPEPEPGEPVVGADTVTVPSFDGTTTVEVPAEAISVARAAVRGVLTADFSRVPVAQGSRLPAVPQPLPKARVGDVVSVQEIDGTLTFSVNVDPDGSGASQPYPVAVRVALVGGSYVFVPQ